MSHQAYQQANARTEDPKSAEYRLFGEVTRALMDAAQAAPDDLKTRINAIDWNRRLWSTLASDCSHPGNNLEGPMRAQIVSLSIWVHRHSSAVMRDGEDIGPLIDINRIIMQGLNGRPTAAAA